MATAFTIGQMVAILKVTGNKIKSQGLVTIIGRTEEYTRDTGNKIICMGKDFINGPMVVNTKVAI